MVTHLRSISLAMCAGGVLVTASLAQDVAPATTVRVDATGVYYSNSFGPAPALPGLDVSPTGTRWTYPDSAAIAESVSVGYRGTLAWIGENLNNQRIALLGTTDNGSPPVPIWTVPKPGASAIRVAAADKAPNCATATINSGMMGTSSTVEVYSAFSTTPIFSVTVPFSVEIDMSADGQRVSVGYSPTSMTAEVDVYDLTSVTPTTPIAMLPASSHGFRQHDLSDDGSTVLLATNTDDHVFDVASGMQTFQDSSTVSHDAHAISADGSAWGRGGFNPMRAWVNIGGTYTMVLNYNDTGLGFPVYSAAGISNDGSTFAAAAYDANNNNRFRVVCFDLTTNPATMLWIYDGTGSGSLQASPSAVSVSDDGKYIAAGTWGVQNNAFPEALLFDRDAGNVPIASLDTPGSVFDLDLSGDGQFMVVGTKAVHANTFGSGGEGYSFDRGGQNHWLVGTPSIGRSITFNTSGPPGDAVFMAFSGGLGPPLTIPGFTGAFQLDLGSLYGVFVVGSVPAGGTFSLSAMVPNSPGIVGASLATQAGLVPSFVLTNPLLMPITP